MVSPLLSKIGPLLAEMDKLQFGLFIAVAVIMGWWAITSGMPMIKAALARVASPQQVQTPWPYPYGPQPPYVPPYAPPYVPPPVAVPTPSPVAPLMPLAPRPSPLPLSQGTAAERVAQWEALRRLCESDPSLAAALPEIDAVFPKLAGKGAVKP